MTVAIVLVAFFLPMPEKDKFHLLVLEHSTLRPRPGTQSKKRAQHFE
jgi:hypothetical protein